MKQMKIAVLIDKKLRSKLFSAKSVEYLSRLGEVVFNKTEGYDEDVMKSLLKDADIAITSWGSPRITGELLEVAPNLKLVAHAAGSVKGIVSEELYKKGIKVSSCACELSRGVSEMAMGLAIASAKNIFAFNDMIHSGKWPEDKSSANELYDINIGVVGCGFAGAHFVELLQNYGVNVMVYDPGRSKEYIEALGARKVELDEIFKESDILSLHAPSIDSTYHMVNEKTLSMMKQNAILINTARGSLIDEKALAECMMKGKLKYACLDVTDPEPPAEDNPLRKIPNCIFTPHVAGLANNGQLKIGRHVCEEIERFESGKQLNSEVTWEMLSTIA